MEDHAAAQDGERRGHRGVSAKQGGGLMRILEGKRAESAVRKLEQRCQTAVGSVEKRVRRIVDDVRKRGDSSLRRYAQKWDGLLPKQPLRVSENEMKEAWAGVSAEFREALQTAANNIRQYCESQKPEPWRRAILPGVEVGQVVRPLESVGCYVPGGRYPLPSTVLMTVIPAQVAGVEHVRVVSPRPAKETLAAAQCLGARAGCSVRGAHRAGGMAFVTQSVPPLTQRVGPG